MGAGQLHIAGTWRKARSGDDRPIVNPATGEQIGRYPLASSADLDEAVAATDRGFKQWRKVSAFERSKVLRSAADLLRERVDEIARILTIEQGKPLFEARAEVLAGADTIDWFAEEGRRAYGRVIPARVDSVRQMVMREPVGPVAAFTPWNFPVIQAVRKVSAALCAGCSVVLKGPEETPASCARLVRAFLDAGVPGDVLSFVLGSPSEISAHLIAHPSIRKISFTGSTPVGKQLAALAGQHMKRITMELGGHAPAIVFQDANVEKAVSVLSASKFRNAGQVCIAPSRFLVHDAVTDEFVERFTAAAKAIRVGDGLNSSSNMGPLAHERRVAVMEGFVSEAQASGAALQTGGKRIGNQGFFFEPTVLTNVTNETRLMNEEPFGPIAAIRSFSNDEDALKEANRLPFGLAAYAFTRSAATIEKVASRIESGMVSVNQHGLGTPELPFGGIKDSGYGSEGGTEALEGYLNSKVVTVGL